METNLKNLVDDLMKDCKELGDEYDYEDQKHDWLKECIRTLYIDYCISLLKADSKSLICVDYKQTHINLFNDGEYQTNPYNYRYDVFSTLLKQLNHEGILKYVPDPCDDETTYNNCNKLIRHIDVYFDGFSDWFSDNYCINLCYDSNTMNW
jgi:hypothetical protein